MTEQSIEGQVAEIVRDSWGLDDLQLDLAIGQAGARRDVYAAHGRSEAADVWNDLLIELCDARRERARVARELSDPNFGIGAL